MRKGDWTVDQVVFLVRAYPTMDRRELKAGIDARGPRRSLDAIGGKARAMGIDRKVNAGQFGYTQPTPLRDYIVAALLERKQVTVAEMAAETKSRRASCWKVFRHLIEQGNCHISGYNPRPFGQWEAVYHLGAGINAKPPKAKAKPPVAPAEPDCDLSPIPAPVSHLWGICIQAGLPAERKAAP